MLPQSMWWALLTSAALCSQAVAAREEDQEHLGLRHVAAEVAHAQASERSGSSGTITQWHDLASTATAQYFDSLDTSTRRRGTRRRTARRRRGTRRRRRAARRRNTRRRNTRRRRSDPTTTPPPTTRRRYNEDSPYRRRYDDDNYEDGPYRRRYDENNDGRPYTTEHGSLLAASHWTESLCHWSMSSEQMPGDVRSVLERDPDSLSDIPSDYTEHEAASAAEEWRLRGLHEHASIASFSRFSLDLMRFAAHPSLIEGAHLAAIDEARHAKLSFDMASHLRGISQIGSKIVNVGVEVGDFPVSDVRLSESLSAMATRTFEEGCMGESSASARLVFAISSLQGNSPFGAVMRELLSDEARHAALAWATVKWAVLNGATLSVPPSNVNQDKFLNSTASTDALATPFLTWAGRIPESAVASLHALVNDAWVFPWVQALLMGSEVPAVVNMPKDKFGDAVAEAGRLVHAEFNKFSFTTTVTV